jgi:hypothetical protein
MPLILMMYKYYPSAHVCVSIAPVFINIRTCFGPFWATIRVPTYTSFSGIDKVYNNILNIISHFVKHVLC